MSLILPSYQSGFAPRDYEPAYPSLWQGCVAAYAPLLGPTGLVLRDAAGKNDGVLTNGPTWDISGGRYALGFDYIASSSRQAVEIPNTASVRGLATASLSLWCNLQTAPATNAGLYYESTGSNGFTKFSIFQSPANALIFVARDTTNSSAFSVTHTPTTEQWIHVTGNYNANTDLMELFVNGISVGTNTTTKGVLVNEVPIVPIAIGAYTDQIGNFNYSCNALIDDVRIYSRVLTPNEILLLSRRRGIAYEPRPRRKWYFRGFSPKKKLLEAKITSTIPGSYQTGYAPRDGEPVYPELWKNCVGAWSAGLGATGGILRDQSGLDNHGTLTNMDPGTDWVISNGSYALDFDGTDDGILTEAQGPATKNRSVSLWFNTAYSVPSGQFAAMLSWNEQNSNSAFQVLHGNGGNLGANGIGASQWGNAVGVTGLNDGKWHHLVIVNADQLWSIYADGIFRNSATLTTTPASNKIAIGRTTVASVGPGSNQNFAGLLDDIRVYSRALSPNEIKLLASQRNIAYAHRKKNIAFRAYDPIKQVGVGKITSIIPGGYHTGVGGLNNEPAYPELTKGLVGGWCPSLGVTGGVLRDNSGQGNHGTLTNMDPGTDWVVSSGKYALDFDGVDDKATLAMQNTATLTASCWVYARNVNNANGEYFVVKWGPNPSINANDFYIGAFGNNWIARSGDGATGQSTLLQTPATANRWTQLSITRDASSLRLFVDGKEMVSTSAVGFQGGGARALELCNLGGFPANCELDDIRIYNRPLSESEIKLLSTRRGIGYDYKSHRSYSKTQSSGLLKRLILTGQT